MKYACDSFEVLDMENIVLKTCNCFSVSAKIRRNLESFFWLCGVGLVLIGMPCTNEMVVFNSRCQKITSKLACS
jgi:hypothetical protein